MLPFSVRILWTCRIYRVCSRVFRDELCRGRDCRTRHGCGSSFPCVPISQSVGSGCAGVYLQKSDTPGRVRHVSQYLKSRIFESLGVTATWIKAIRSLDQDYYLCSLPPWNSLMHPVIFLALLSFLGLAMALDAEVRRCHRVVYKPQFRPLLGPRRRL